MTGPPPDLGATFRGRAALVTGGLGFIGSNLGRWLVDAGAEVTLVDSLIPEFGGNLQNVADYRDRARIHVSDVRDPSTFSPLLREQDFLFNLAGQTSHLDSMRDPLRDMEINVEAQLRVLETCRRDNPGVRVVFAGTRQVYGRPLRLPVDEEHPTRPVDVNGVHKLAGESYHLLYGDVHGIRSTVLRLTNTYGPGMRIKDARQTFLGIWIRRLLDGQPFEVYGDGEQLRDLNYVDDVVHALLAAAATPEAVGRIYNLGSREVVSLSELARRLVEAAGDGSFRFVPFPPDSRAIDIGDYHADYGRARSELGWEPAVPLEEGLGRTIAYYRRHGEAYR